MTFLCLAIDKAAQLGRYMRKQPMQKRDQIAKRNNSPKTVQQCEYAGMQRTNYCAEEKVGKRRKGQNMKKSPKRGF